MSDLRRVWPLPRVECRTASWLKDSRAVTLVTSQEIERALGPVLAIDVCQTLQVETATLAHWKELAEICTGEVVFALGGGVVVDAAKYIASRRSLELVCVPTALSVDAYFTWASGYREEGCVRYLETRPPDLVILDLDLLAAAPPAVRAAGLCDVLSIATGCFDWRYAEDRGRNPAGQRYLDWAARVAQALLDEALCCAPSAGRGESAGLLRLADLLALEVQLCNQIGHSRPEEGSEHYFAYALEDRVGQGLAHGDLVGPGIVLLAELQGLDPEPLREALLEGGIPLDLEHDPRSRETLVELPGYSERHELPFGRAHTLTQADVDALPQW